MARILRPGGLFWATTPHGAGISIRLLKTEWSVVSPPEHLQLFSVKGMRALLTAAGFGRVQIATQGVNPYEIVHRLRGHRASAGDSDAADGKPFSRVESGYRLNESLTSSPSRRALKNSLNSLLNVSRLGDSLKIRAVL